MFQCGLLINRFSTDCKLYKYVCLCCRKGLKHQKKALKELRAMFDQTSYFDSEQITSILMVGTGVSVQMFSSQICIGPLCYLVKSGKLNLSRSKTSKNCLKTSTIKILVFKSKLPLFQKKFYFNFAYFQDLSNYKYDKMVNKALGLLNKFYSAKTKMFKMSVQALVRQKLINV